ncbi:betaine-aldehyde dehydrogenase [Xylogone sp. PMI_703]|nr:betaine-aldehyde dehydrogenase [Xylogone sp. PMI_703]
MALPKIENCMPKHLDLYYGGEWHAPRDGHYHETYCPGDGHVITKVAFAGTRDTEAAIEAAHGAFASWRAVPSIERGRILRKAAQILRDHGQELALLDALNTGNPVAIMAQDANMAADHLDYFAGLIPAIHGETTHLDDDSFNYTVREPLGVVARIIASNHPLMFAATRLSAALAVGNTVVLKTPEQAPLSALRLVELIGGLFPPGILNVLPGGIECGKTLSTHKLVSKVTLTGSVPTGKAIQKAAAETLKLTSFELGGKNALVAYPDTDLDKLVDGIVRGMNWGWCGQSCGSTSRVFLHESHHDVVLARVKEQVEKLFRPGNPIDATTTMGAMVSKAAQDRVLGYIAIAEKEGARLVTGGKVPVTADTQGGYFVQPTIFADVKQTMRIANEEVFGPVLSVFKWTDEEQLYMDVNAVDYGLTGAVFTSDIKTAQTAVRKIQAGTVWVNTSSTHYHGMPFGGYKQSGIGREDTFEEMREMTQTKAVHVKL